MLAGMSRGAATTESVATAPNKAPIRRCGKKFVGAGATDPLAKRGVGHQGEQTNLELWHKEAAHTRPINLHYPSRHQAILPIAFRPSSRDATLRSNSRAGSDLTAAAAGVSPAAVVTAA